MNGTDLLRIVDSMHREKNIPKEVIFDGIEAALQLATENRVRGGTDLTAEITATNTHAVSLGTSNRVLGATPVVNANSSNVSGGQILVGYLDPTNSHATLDSSSASGAGACGNASPLSHCRSSIRSRQVSAAAH